MRQLNNAERELVKAVWAYYARYGRTTLPWRQTVRPYHVLVSELMLQQTQVDRVVPKYRAFIKSFPSFAALARVPLGEVLKHWQGLGYNRRAKMLHETARQVSKEYQGRLPTSLPELLVFPGIGPYTARAVLAFAYNQPVSLIETNIRAVYLHHFFSQATDVRDDELDVYIERTLDRVQPREWYWALMDYGSMLKKKYGNPNTRSATYTKQSPFRGSSREVRGALVRTLTDKQQTRKTLLRLLPFDDACIDAQLERLVAERLLLRRGVWYMLPDG